MQIMDADVEIFDEPDAQDIVNPKGDIVFRNVSFEYPDDHNKVFANLNLQIHAGEKLAIVGPSGGGKTTLCNLIPRFYDVSCGEITLDGRNVRKHKCIVIALLNNSLVCQNQYSVRISNA